jgi:hypothetical protein
VTQDAQERERLEDLRQRLEPIVASLRLRQAALSALWVDGNGLHLLMSTNVTWLRDTLDAIAEPGAQIALQIHRAAGRPAAAAVERDG